MLTYSKMKFRTRTFFVHVCMVLSLATILNNPIIVSESCYCPAIFNFGDSNSDTGGGVATLDDLNRPYGETFFGMPEGRFSDGRLMIDFIAESFGIPYLSAYLDSLGTNFSTGANFAIADSTITLPESIMPNGNLSPFYLDEQYSQFTKFKAKSQMIRGRGGIFKDLMPKDEYFSKALYTFDTGQNDLADGLLSNKTIEEVNASVPAIINNFSKNVKNIYKTGARSFWIHNTGPVGCLPYVLNSLQNIQLDSAGCAKPYNDVCQYFNEKLREATRQLRKDLPSATIIYVDTYSVKYSLVKEPHKYGFEDPLVVCCGYGGKYNYNSQVRCGNTLVVNGSQIFVGSCKNPSVRVNWDGVHYTEAANRFVYTQISSGQYSDPPVQLKLACGKSQ